jgi:hypothetical protein
MKKLLIGICAVAVGIGIMSTLERKLKIPLCPRYAGCIVEHKSVVRGVFGGLMPVLVVRSHSATESVEVFESDFARYRVGDTIICQSNY